MIKHIILILLLSAVSFAQIYERKNIEVVRANDRTLIFTYNEDLSNDTLLFVVKATRSLSSPRLIQKESTDITEMKTSYFANVSMIEIYLQSQDTEDRDTARHWYDITRVHNGDSTTLFLGWFDIWSNVATRFDGTNLATDGSRFYVAGAFVDSTTADSSLFMWDEDTQSIGTIPYQEYVGTILPDSILYPKDSTSQRTYSNWKYVDKTTAQTITAQKNFRGKVHFPDSNKTHLDFYNASDSSFGGFALTTRNFWMNADHQPNVVMRLGYNIKSSGGSPIISVDSLSAEFGDEWESHYINGINKGFERHLMFFDTSGTLHRPYSYFLNKYNGRTEQQDRVDNYTYFDSDNNFLFQQISYGTSAINYYQMPYRHTFLNNTSGLGWVTSNGSSTLFAPYFDDEDRYRLGHVRVLYSDYNLLDFSQMDLRLTNNYGLQSFDDDSNTVSILKYASDRLKLQARNGDNIYLVAQDVFIQDTTGKVFNIKTPTYPLDTTGVKSNEIYVDNRTGNLTQRIPENIVTNGDFTTWTGAGKSATPNGWTFAPYPRDTTTVYIEQNPVGKLHFIWDGSDKTAYLLQATSSIGVNYGYSFTVSEITDTAIFYIVGYGSIPITATGEYSGSIVSVGNEKFKVLPAYGAGSITLDNFRLWIIDGEIDAPPYDVPVILDSLGQRVIPDTTDITDGYVVKYVGGEVVWSPDISTGGSPGVFHPDGVTIDTTAGGLARVVPSKVTLWDGVSTKQNLDADLTDLADGELTASKVGGVKDADYGDVTVSSGAWSVENNSHNHTITNVTGLQDSINKFLERGDSTIYLTPSDAASAYSIKSHTHTEFADTFNVAGWSVGFGNSSIDTIVTGSFGGVKIPNNVTITEVSAFTNSGTITFNIEERAETTPNTAGTDVMTSDLVADTDQQETSTFSNTTLDRNDWLILTIVSITGDPTNFSVTVRGVKTN
jgi:hypothetical protein